MRDGAPTQRYRAIVYLKMILRIMTGRARRRHAALGHGTYAMLTGNYGFLCRVAGAFDAMANYRIVRRTSLRAAPCRHIAHKRLQTRLCRTARKIERCASSRFRTRDRSPLTGKEALADRLRDRCRDVHRDGHPQYDSHRHAAHPRVAVSAPSFFFHVDHDRGEAAATQPAARCGLQGRSSSGLSRETFGLQTVGEGVTRRRIRTIGVNVSLPHS